MQQVCGRNFAPQMLFFVYNQSRVTLRRRNLPQEPYPTWRSLALPSAEAELSLTAQIARHLPLDELHEASGGGTRGPSRQMQFAIDALDAAGLCAATPDGQAARVQLLQGAVVVFVILSYSGKRFGLTLWSRQKQWYLRLC